MLLLYGIDQFFCQVKPLSFFWHFFFIFKSIRDIMKGMIVSLLFIIFFDRTPCLSLIFLDSSKKDSQGPDLLMGISLMLLAVGTTIYLLTNLL